MPLISHGYRFRNQEERAFYDWLRKELGEEIRILHNFFYFDIEADDFREVDFMIITKNLFIIEHKTSCSRSYNALEKLRPIRTNLMNHLQQRGLKKKRWVEYAVVCKKGRLQTHSQELSDCYKNRIYRIRNRREVKDVIDNPDFIDKRNTIHENIQKQIVKALACQEFKFSALTDNIFQIFDAFIEWNKILRVNNIKEREFWFEKVPLIYNHFQSLDYILCTAFLGVEKIQNRKGFPLFLNYHRTSVSSIKKLRPVYWGCATKSEYPDCARQLQVSIHLSRGPWMYEEKEAEAEDHLAFKLCFFRSVDAEVLRRIKRNLKRKPNRFTDLLKELKEQDSLFTFYRSVADRNERQMINDFDEVGEAILDELLRYDEDGETGVPVPRSTEFLKFVKWNEVRDNFQRADSAVEYVKREITKLLPLFQFFTS